MQEFFPNRSPEENSLEKNIKMLNLLNKEENIELEGTPRDYREVRQTHRFSSNIFVCQKQWNCNVLKCKSTKHLIIEILRMHSLISFYSLFAHDVIT